MMMLIWGFILLLAVAVIFLVWFQFKQQGESTGDTEYQQNLEQKVVHLEENLKKTLEIMQDLAKKMHVQQEVLDNTSHRLTEVEFQNAELIKILQRNIQP